MGATLFQKYLLSGFCIFCTSTFINAQTITILDRDTQKPVSEVHVYNDSRTKLLTTDSDGKVDISSFSEREDILIQHVSYDFVFFTKRKLAALEYQVFLDFSVLPEIVLSVSKMEIDQRQVAEQMGFLTQKTIRTQNPQTSADLLQNLPSVAVQKTQMGGGSINLRGLEANKVLLVVDGVRMNNAIYRTGHLQNVITLDPMIMRRVEVIYGPSSIIYGSDALGGVIHFYTQMPQPNKPFKVVGQVRRSTANDEVSTHTNFSFSVDDISSFTSFSWQSFGDLRMGKDRKHGFSDWGKVHLYSENSRDNYEPYSTKNSNPELQKGTGYAQGDVFQKLLWTPNPHHKVLFNFQYSSSSDIPRFDKLMEREGDSLKFAEWYYGPQKRSLYSLQWTYRPTKPLGIFDQMVLNASFQDVEESRINRKFKSIRRITNLENVKIWGITADAFKTLSGDSSRLLNYGTDVRLNVVGSRAFAEELEPTKGGKIAIQNITYDVPERYPDRGSYYGTAGIYMLYMHRLGHSNRFKFGLRYTHNVLRSQWSNNLFSNFLKGEDFLLLSNSALTFSLNYLFTPHINWKFSFVLSTGFRFPNVDDVGQIREKNGKLAIPNLDLRPEKAYNFEIGISYYNRDIGVGISSYVYFNNIIDYISKASFALENGATKAIYEGDTYPLVANQNLGSAYIFGNSTQMVLNLGRYFKVSASSTYTYGVKNTGEPLPSIPPFFAKGSAGVYTGRVNTYVYIDYYAQKWGRDMDQISGIDNLSQAASMEAGYPSWYTLNAVFSYEFHTNVSISFALKNMWDRHYKTFNSSISAPGRNFVVSMRWSN